MNKGDLINEVAKVVSTKKEAQEAVDCVFSSIAGALKREIRSPWLDLGASKWLRERPEKDAIRRPGKRSKLKHLKPLNSRLAKH